MPRHPGGEILCPNNFILPGDSMGVFFWDLKSAKSSENGRLPREKFQLPKECEF